MIAKSTSRSIPKCILTVYHLSLFISRVYSPLTFFLRQILRTNSSKFDRGEPTIESMTQNDENSHEIDPPWTTTRSFSIFVRSSLSATISKHEIQKSNTHGIDEKGLVNHCRFVVNVLCALFYSFVLFLFLDSRKR